MHDFVTLLRWLASRIFFLKRYAFSFINFCIYSNSSTFLYKSQAKVKNEITHTLYYNFFGRFLWSSKEILALITNGKIFKKSIVLEGYHNYNFDKEYQQGSHNIQWPISPFIELSRKKIHPKFFDKISHSYQLSHENNPLNMDKEFVWEEHINEFKKFYFNDSGELIQSKMINFRKEFYSSAHILTDHYETLSKEMGYFKSYLKSIDLVLEYHRFSNLIHPSILGSLSESYAGELSTPIYRGQRLSKRILFLATVMSEIQKHITFQDEPRKVIVDIGGGFGHLGRFTSNYIPNSCYVLVELEEMACFGSYFLQYCFPNKKIATLVDILDRLENFEALTQEYDFIILPTWGISYIANESVDLYIATGSISEMPEHYAQMYLTEIDRTLKYNGYFYTTTRVKIEEHKPYLYIFYKWKLQSKFLTLSYVYHPVNLLVQTSPQWIGKKIR